MIKYLLAMVCLVFWAPWVHANVIYRVTADYAGGYHYLFHLEFSNDQGTKSEVDLLNEALSFGGGRFESNFWGDAGSRFAGPYHWPDSEKHGTLRFDTGNPLAMEYTVDTTGWTWQGDFDPVLNRSVVAEACAINMQRVQFCGVGREDGLPDVVVDLYASRVGLQVTRVPEPSSLPLTALALVAIALTSSHIRSRKH